MYCSGRVFKLLVQLLFLLFNGLFGALCINQVLLVSLLLPSLQEHELVQDLLLLVVITSFRILPYPFKTSCMLLIIFQFLLFRGGLLNEIWPLRFPWLLIFKVFRLIIYSLLTPSDRNWLFRWFNPRVKLGRVRLVALELLNHIRFNFSFHKHKIRFCFLLPLPLFTTLRIG